MNNLIKSIKVTITLIILLGISYVMILSIFALIATPTNGKVELVYINNKVVGAKNIGQSFCSPEYFRGRPSATGYKAHRSAGANDAISDSLYIKKVALRIQELKKAFPYLKDNDIPIDMITASGSGIDPHISVKGAYMQVQSIAKHRGMSVEDINNIIKSKIKKPYFSIFGTYQLNVLELNIALDNATRK